VLNTDFPNFALTAVNIQTTAREEFDPGSFVQRSCPFDSPIVYKPQSTITEADAVQTTLTKMSIRIGIAVEQNENNAQDLSFPYQCVFVAFTQTKYAFSRRNRELKILIPRGRISITVRS